MTIAHASYFKSVGNIVKTMSDQVQHVMGAYAHLMRRSQVRQRLWSRMPENTRGRGELGLPKAWGAALLYPYDDFFKHRIVETADSLFSQNNYRKMESVLFHCLSSDAYLLWGTGGNTSNSTVSLVKNVDGVQQCISRCQYHMIMSVIMTYWTRPYLQIIPNTKYP